ncbi:MAG: bifunctional 5,10-methylenetetrahydrofolate dehydrogenase/5,10-methenyltetrahydrofolate cyclohydrolase [Syntrophomonadaceae bacterium]|nr:bifunctional 5,10-methylenetetrahydrofolate dehydrogenase/5,10-methenyltetrahydrofolate cyclohydrolase [Syntrophomonadaceae bacterium]
MIEMLVYGKQLREEMKAGIKQQAAQLPIKLAIVKIGDDKASQAYVNSLVNFGQEVGIPVVTVCLEKHITQAEAEQAIRELNQDPDITGIMVQKPLPGHINDNTLIQTVDYHKDVEGLHYYNLGRLLANDPGVCPSTPKAIMTMLKANKVDLTGKKVTIVGRSTIVGSPLAVMMTAQHATVTLCHSRTRNLEQETRAADIVVAAVGKPWFITADMVSEGCIIMDAGINVDESGSIRGDVHPKAAARASIASAVPGGIGVITVAELFDNLLILASQPSRN